MNNSIDIIGIENVVKYIEASGKSKFTIYRAGQNGMNIPVFECDETQTNGNAVQEFKRWAEIINNTVIYKLVLFNVTHLNEDENGNQTIKKTRQKSGKMECLFAMHEQTNNFRSDRGDKGFNVEQIEAQIEAKYKKREEDNAILSELKSMREEMAILRAQNAEDDEDDEDEVGGLGNPSQIKEVLGLIQMFTGKGQNAQPPVINGIDDAETIPAPIVDDKKQKLENINKAIKRLFVHNKNLDTDLLLLADLADTDKGTFNILIGMLRNK